MTEKLRIVLLTHGGAEEVLLQLCALDCIEIVGVFVEEAKPPQRSFTEKIKRSIRYDGYLATTTKLLRSVAPRKNATQDNNDVLAVLKQISKDHGIPYLVVSNYHSTDSMNLLKSVKADLGIVFGTNILKESVFGIPRLGTINFHNGLVPFYRGGPPVFWELFNDEKEVGLTVHWMAAKVDAGDVILQDTVPLSYDFAFGLDFEKFIANYRSGLRTRYAELLARAVADIASGRAARIVQDPNLGKRYRLPTMREKDEMRRRLSQRRKRVVKSPTVLHASK
ncbi:MAG TPA: formyltransferase family protein [Pyrinomonadaceae bacterium]|jgi:Methionyl-tRNA formyltransferase|nr:formyltransferase family protein [Pyrinomonadaceae bacterium]